MVHIAKENSMFRNCKTKKLWRIINKRALFEWNSMKMKTSPWQQQPQWQLQTRFLGFLQLCPLSQWNSPPKRTLTSLNVNQILLEYQLQSALLCWYGLLVIKVGSWKCFCSTSLKRESIKKNLDFTEKWLWYFRLFSYIHAGCICRDILPGASGILLPSTATLWHLETVF